MIVLDLLRKRLPDIPVLFLETGYHFAETYAYRDRMAQAWNLNLKNLAAKKSVAEQEAEFGILNRTDPGKCCNLRKVEPLFEALQHYDVWFTGLRREQSPTRKNLKIVEHHELASGKVLLKVSPLAAWTWGQVWKYTAENKIDYLPLYDLGYRSIGCEPCTAIPQAGADPRSGRWGGAKLECGIHTASKQSDAEADAAASTESSSPRTRRPKTSELMQIAIGFLIALAVGLTGIGGGSFTVPALMLIVGLPAAASVGTAFVFAGVLRLIAAPFYMAGRHIHWRYLWLLLQGAIPGLLIGTYLLRLLSTHAGSPVVVILLGLLLTASSSVTFFRRVQNPGFAHKNSQMAPMARIADRYRVGIFVRRRRRARHSVAAELFGDDAAAGSRHRPALRPSASGNRRRIPLEVRLDQQPSPASVAFRRHPRSPGRLPIRPPRASA